MKAMIITAFGGPDVFQKVDVPKPVPHSNQLLIKVYAVSLNPVDYKIRQSGEWAGVKPPAILGYDAAGVVEATGPDVKNFKVGEAVYYSPEIFGKEGGGSYAEYQVVKETIVGHKPANLSFEEAASIPLAGATAWDALVTRVKLEAGEAALIHAGAGGVGSLAVQIAKALGGQVFATASGDNLDFVRSLGADRVIDYKTEDFVEVIRHQTSGGEGVEVVFDTVGGDTVTKSIAITKPHGRIVTIAYTTDLNAAYFKNLTVHFEFMEREADRLARLREWLEEGKLKPVIDSLWPLEAVAQAHQKLEKGGVRGKIILKVAE